MHQRLDRLHGRCPALHRFLAAHRLQPQLSPAPHQHAHPVAADDPPGLVGQHEGRGDRIERLVDRAAEAVDLREGRLLGVERAKLPPLQVAAGDRRHLVEEAEVAPLDVGLVGMMKHLDHPGAGSRPVDRRGDHQQVGRIAGKGLSLGVGQLRAGRHQQAGGAPEERLHELPVRLLRFGRVGQTGRLHACMADRFDATLFTHQPDQPRHRPHRLQHAVEQAPEEVGLRQVAAGELLDFGDERPDLLPGLFDRIGIDRAHRTRLENDVAGKWWVGKWGMERPGLRSPAVRPSRPAAGAARGAGRRSPARRRPARGGPPPSAARRPAAWP